MKLFCHTFSLSLSRLFHQFVWPMMMLTFSSLRLVFSSIFHYFFLSRRILFRLPYRQLNDVKRSALHRPHSYHFDGNDDKPKSVQHVGNRNLCDEQKTPTERTNEWERWIEEHKQQHKSKTSTMNYNQKKCMMEKLFLPSLIFIFDFGV